MVIVSKTYAGTRKLFAATVSVFFLLAGFLAVFFTESPRLSSMTDPLGMGGVANADAPAGGDSATSNCGDGVADCGDASAGGADCADSGGCAS